MLNVYAADWCPHCQQTVAFLKKNAIAFNYINIEKQPEDVVKQVIAVNGGKDWVVPTLEYKGQWREGKVFDADGLKNDLRKMGVIPSHV
ncbi:MAG: NrdH-redoxin [Desulfobacteraceae bacterium IS3]|nr:MAG: NrdH-redoxin [Desulfobacteraceae bacterium IS3]